MAFNQPVTGSSPVALILDFFKTQTLFYVKTNEEGGFLKKSIEVWNRLWIILLLSLMSLTLARSEREQRLLTHANFIELVRLTL